MTKISDAQLAIEIEDVIRSMPCLQDFSGNPDLCVPWLGRASATMNAWDPCRAIIHFEPHVFILTKTGNYDFSTERRALLIELHHAKNNLRLKNAEPISFGVKTEHAFDYCAEVNQLIKTAKLDLFFIDAYIDADFVSQYLTHVPRGTKVRILAREKLPTLRSAIQVFVAQTQTEIEIRSATGFNDRYVLVDKVSCYQSGASFKNGIKKAPTSLTQITDAFIAVQTTYEQLWMQGDPVWP
jgi:hypothetical protein